MSTEKWLRSSLRHIAQELNRLGHQISHTTVERLLKARGYSLKANEKRLAGADHPDREQQFQYIAAQKQAYLERGWPVISVERPYKRAVTFLAGARW